ncbi:LPS export ABC transporter periplasmic protein LptC [Novosphingobium sp. PASSN1]|uniref:LPS export ABC transporter periplasmic protein LptC n=1 Tax=Novosphingobium sp. PASSN1 TaxID=2015561 RepID=UPI000BDC0CB1|nr:LPS export ABC transporter periplasmic protein LptC [Novosphingobium sp. PASSN1]OYU36290.1 MAG: LPS export ABC transporter periplasmic protein LptC [Novosphingobium sp. PASSN1]
MTQQADSLRGRRQRFAAPGGFHDRMVRLVAVGMPTIIGALLAVLVIAPFSPRGEISFLLDRNKVAMVTDRLRVVSAMYRGQDDNGRNFSVTAGSAVQHSEAKDEVEMRDITARVMLTDGPASLTTGAGVYDFGKQEIVVPTPVNFETSDGYRMVTGGADIDIGKRRLVSQGRAEGRIPAGTFSADRISADLEARTIKLDGHARLTMEPGKLKMP